MILPVIKGNKLEGLIDGSKPCPAKFIQIENGEALNDKYEEWQVSDQILLGWLYSTVTTKIATQLIDCKSSQELWSQIQELVGANTKSKIMWYKSEIQRTRKGSLKMQEYLNKMKSLADNLQLAGCPFSQLDLFIQILGGLDNEYTPIVVQLLDKSELSWVEFQTTLLTFERRLELIQSFQNLNLNSPTVNFAATSFNQRSSTNNSDSKSNSSKGNWRGSNSFYGGRSRGRGR